ncbi:MAG TPA: urea transporter [Ignavibacteria bacterium]
MILAIRHHIKSVLNSYSIILFSDNIFLSIILILITFLDPFAGICGVFSIIISLIAVHRLGFNKEKIYKGLYTFNSLLVGLGIGVHFQYDLNVILLIFFASLFTLFLTISFEAILGKYNLPFLSIPFLIAYWVSVLESPLVNLRLSERGLYIMNDIYSLGGGNILKTYVWWNDLIYFPWIKLYFTSLGAIFFQYSLLAGIIIAIGLLYHSRIAFSLSLIGFYTAYFFFNLISVNIPESALSLFGFNFILTAIAVGGYFLVPSKKTYLWAILLTPVTVILFLGLTNIFSVWHLFMYSLPFNIIALLFIYSLKLRYNKSPGLSEVYIQRNSPESNLYAYLNNNYRFKKKTYYSISLPFFGYWDVSQGHKGEITHKGDWKYAWDFVIKDSEGKTYGDTGGNIENYYCYNKAVLAPADGYIEEIIDGIPDNLIGDVNIEQNWGNTIIIRHGDHFYSKLSHLKANSFKVAKGEWVKTGQMIALCGSSGRSPEPHLHFQLQATPIIEGKTIDYPIVQYVVKKENGLEFLTYDIPKVNERISNMEVSNILKNGYHFIPGQKMIFEVEQKGKKKLVEWEVFTDINNYSYIYCKDTNSYAYFANDDKVFYFYDFLGSKKSLLYYFFLGSYKVPLGYYQDLIVTDSLAVNLVFSKPGLFIQDFIAPFFMFVGSDYRLSYHQIDEIINPTEIKLKSEVTKIFFRKKINSIEFETIITNKNISGFKITKGNKIITAKCI